MVTSATKNIEKCWKNGEYDDSYVGQTGEKLSGQSHVTGMMRLSYKRRGRLLNQLHKPHLGMGYCWLYPLEYTIEL
jgi:hypothetical protein